MFYFCTYLHCTHIEIDSNSSRSLADNLINSYTYKAKPNSSLLLRFSKRISICKPKSYDSNVNKEHTFAKKFV